MKKTLGRGLDALIPKQNESLKNEEFTVVVIEKIKASKKQPRKRFDEEKLDSLAKSIKEHGILQPVTVKKTGDFFTIIAGERRFRAAKKAGLKEIPCRIKKSDEKESDLLSLIENVQREDLNALEEARGYKNLSDAHGFTQEEISKLVGKSRSYIANTLRLLKLDDKTKDDLIKGKITSSQARALLTVDLKERDKAAEKLKKREINIRDIENAKKKADVLDKQLDKILMEDFKERFIEKIGRKTSFKRKGKIRQVIIDCYSISDLEELLEGFGERDFD